jgi:hypothetical protein
VVLNAATVPQHAVFRSNVRGLSLDTNGDSHTAMDKAR